MTNRTGFLRLIELLFDPSDLVAADGERRGAVEIQHHDFRADFGHVPAFAAELREFGPPVFQTFFLVAAELVIAEGGEDEDVLRLARERSPGEIRRSRRLSPRRRGRRR